MVRRWPRRLASSGRGGPLRAAEACLELLAAECPCRSQQEHDREHERRNDGPQQRRVAALQQRIVGGKQAGGAAVAEQGKPVMAKIAAYTARPAPAAAAWRSSAAERNTMRHTNIAASASHSATDSRNAAMCAVSKSTIVTATDSAAPSAWRDQDRQVRHHLGPDERGSRKRLGEYRDGSACSQLAGHGRRAGDDDHQQSELREVAHELDVRVHRRGRGKWMTTPGWLSGAGHQGRRALVQLGIVGINVLLNLWLIPAYSWRGAAWASLISDGALVLGLWVAIVSLRRTGTMPGIDSRR